MTASIIVHWPLPALPPPGARLQGQAAAITESVAVEQMTACTLSSAVKSSGISKALTEMRQACRPHCCAKAVAGASHPFGIAERSANRPAAANDTVVSRSYPWVPRATAISRPAGQLIARRDPWDLMVRSIHPAMPQSLGLASGVYS